MIHADSFRMKNADIIIDDDSAIVFVNCSHLGTAVGFKSYFETIIRMSVAFQYIVAIIQCTPDQLENK